MRNLNKYMQIVITVHHNYYLGRQLSHQQGEEKSFRSLSLMAMRLSKGVVKRGQGGPGLPIFGTSKTSEFSTNATFKVCVNSS